MAIPVSRFLLLAGLAAATATSGCSTASFERHVRSASRDMARGLSRAGRQVENRLEDWGRKSGGQDFFQNLFETNRPRPASYGATSRNVPSRTSSRSSEPAPRPSGTATGSPPALPKPDAPFASPVPGRTGYVKLPGRTELPEVDVRGIAPGTPIEVPDPDTPGKAIRFRVP